MPSPSMLSADAIAKSPSQGHRDPPSASQPIGLRGKDGDPCCRSCFCASLASIPLNLQSLITPLAESLRAEFQRMFSARLKEVLQPLKEEVSIIKLWLARVANHLEHAEAHGEHASVSDLPELFGPCSPVKHNLPSSILASLTTACTTVDSLVCQDTSANTAVSVLGEMPMKISGTEIHRETDLTTNEVVAGAFEADSRQMMSTVQTIEVPSETSMLLQVVTSVEDLVVVEDASDDEETTLVAQTTFEDPIFLTTIEDDPSHSMVEGNTEPVLVEDAPDDEEATLAIHGPSLSMVEDNIEPRLVEDPPIETRSSSSTRAREDEDLACPPLAPSSPSTTAVRR